MSDDEEKVHWSCSIWSTHLFGVHVSVIIPILGVLFTPMPWYFLIGWVLVSVVTHFSGFGVVGSFRRLKVRFGRYVHGESRIRKNKLTKIKRNRGSL